MKIAPDDCVVLNHLARSHLLMCHDEYEVAVQQGRTVAAMLASAAHVYKHVACLAMASHVCVCVCVRAMMAMKSEGCKATKLSYVL